MEKKVERFIEENELFKKSDSIGVAVSGGADSMVLLFLLSKLGYNVTALHFEHGIRGEESLADARFVEGYCADHDIPVRVGHGDIPAYSEANRCSIETAARILRYGFLTGFGFDAVATAHHSGDNAETVLQHIIRGTGIKGLVGILPKSGNIVRPLLCVSRSEIEEYAAENGVPYITDSTNADMRYTRNRVRSELIPLLMEMNPGAEAAILRLSKHAGAVQGMIEKAATEIDVEYGDGYASADRETLMNAPQPVAQYVLYGMFCHIGQKIDIESDHFEEIMALSRTGAEKHIKNGCSARYEYGKIVISRDPDGGDVSFCVPFRGRADYPGGSIVTEEDAVYSETPDRDEEFFGYIPEDAVVRTRRSGDMFHPMGGKRKKLNDYLTDIKIPSGKRDGMPLLASGSEIIWVIGCNMSEDYKVRDGGPYVALRNIKD